MSWRDPKFRYVPVSKQGEGYLAKRFRQIKAEQQRNAAEVQAKVTAIVKPQIKGKVAA